MKDTKHLSVRCTRFRYDRNTGKKGGGSSMIISEKIFTVRGLTYHIRSASMADAKQLSALRLKIDGETEYLDREPGEAFLDEKAFVALIEEDTKQSRHLFLVAAIEGKIVGF